MLRKSTGLKKSEFSELIGVANAWRKDRNKPSRGEILAICNAFKIDETWLLSSHPQKQWIQMFETDAGANESNSIYQLHGAPPNRSLEELTGIPESMGMGQAFKLLLDIYETGDPELIRHALDGLKKIMAEAAGMKHSHTSAVRWSNIEDRIKVIENRLDSLQVGIKQISEKLLSGE